jgi:hypothetical protein
MVCVMLWLLSVNDVYHLLRCRRKKLKPVPGGSRERPSYQLFAGGRRRRGTIHCRIEYFSKEALKARRRDQYQRLRNHVARVLEGMILKTAVGRAP